MLMRRQASHFHQRRIATFSLGGLAFLSVMIVGGQAAAAPITSQDTAPIDHGLSFDVAPRYTVAGSSPGNYETGPGGFFDGVGDFLRQTTGGTTFRCTASLLNQGGRQYGLTAAHCLTDANGLFNTVSGEVIFEGDNGPQTIAIDDFIVHPGWNGDILRGDDIALLKLAEEPDPDITSYDISTAANPLNQAVEKVGYGRTGTGTTGDTSASGTKHNGLNLYDAFGDSMWANFGQTPGVDFIAGSQLQYDFDNGLPGNDAFGALLGLDELGFGLDEVMSAPGDSGGPSFLNNEIAGVTSYGLRIGNGSDIDGALNSTYGEFGGDTNVAFYHDWIQDNAVAEEVPAPGTLPLLAAGLLTVGLLIARQGRRRDATGDTPI